MPGNNLINEMAALLVVPKVINNKEIAKIPDRIVNLANEWITELSPKKEEVEKEIE